MEIPSASLADGRGLDRRKNQGLSVCRPARLRYLPTQWQSSLGIAVRADDFPIGQEEQPWYVVSW